MKKCIWSAIYYRMQFHNEIPKLGTRKKNTAWFMVVGWPELL